MPDFEDCRDPFVVVHQGCVGSRILKGRELPQQPVAFPVHRKEPAPEGLAQDEAFIAVAPPEIIDVRHLDSCRRIGIESFPDVSDAFIVNSQILVGAAQVDQILRLFPEVERSEAIDVLNPLDVWLCHLMHKKGEHADPAVLGPGHKL